MGKRIPVCVVALWLIGACAADVSAQGFAGGLRGVVKDANGVVPGAEVTMTNEGTAAARTVVTNDDGAYAFENVLPATYTVKVSLTGFKTLERAGIRIGTQQILQLDLTLEVGQLQETITVTGAAPLIDTSNASVASTLDKATLETLPTAGRNAFFLAVTVPNVIPSGDPQFVRQQDQTNSALLSLAGGPRRGNNYTLEGVSITDLRNRAVIIPNIESVDEVKVQVSTFDAEMGRTGGGVFNTVGKSGTNNWHGSGLYQNRPELRSASSTSPTRAAWTSRTATSTWRAAPSAVQLSTIAPSSGQAARVTRRSPAATPCSRCRPSASATAISHRVASRFTTP